MENGKLEWEQDGAVSGGIIASSCMQKRRAPANDCRQAPRLRFIQVGDQGGFSLLRKIRTLSAQRPTFEGVALRRAQAALDASTEITATCRRVVPALIGGFVHSFDERHLGVV